MPIYRVFINNHDTKEYVTGSSPTDAYADVCAAVPLTYKDHVRLKEVESPEARPGFPVGRRTLQPSAASILEQELYIEKPEGSE